MSPYVRVANNPLKYVDPDGEEIRDVNTNKRISDRQAYTRTVMAMHNYFSGTGTAEIDFYGRYNTFYDIKEGVEHRHRHNPAVLGLGLIKGHKSEALIVNTYAKDKVLAGGMNVRTFMDSEGIVYLLEIENKNQEWLIRVRGHSVEELNNVLKDSGYQFIEDQESGRFRLQQINDWQSDWDTFWSPENP